MDSWVAMGEGETRPLANEVDWRFSKAYFQLSAGDRSQILSDCGGQLASYSLEWVMIKGGRMVVEVGNKALETGMVSIMGVILGRDERDPRWKEEKEERGEKESDGQKRSLGTW